MNKIVACKAHPYKYYHGHSKKPALYQDCNNTLLKSLILNIIKLTKVLLSLLSKTSCLLHWYCSVTTSHQICSLLESLESILILGVTSAMTTALGPTSRMLCVASWDILEPQAIPELD